MTATKPLTLYEKQLQQSSTDWRQLCDSHERTLPDQYCKLKRDRPLDPFTGCVGWQMKTGKKVTLN